MDSELPSLIYVAYRALKARLGAFRRSKPVRPARILVAPHLRLGDALLVTALLAKLREQYPAAEIVLVCALPMLPLYQTRPYGVIVWPYHPRKLNTVSAMLAKPGFDLAIVPGDNRHVWLASALESKWIVAHAGGATFKNWLADELIGYPDQPASMSEIFAALCAGPAPRPFKPGDWQQPDFVPFTLPSKPYAVLHVGASTPLRHWTAAHWRGVAQWLAGQGLIPVWSGGPDEEQLVKQIDPGGLYFSYAGQLDLAQIWALMAQAALFVSPDTGVAHLARLTGVCAITIFGPGDRRLFGRGDFWHDTPCIEVGLETFPCRDQHVIFDRYRAWINHCSRSPAACNQPGACMRAVEPSLIIDAVKSLWAKRVPQGHTLARSKESE